MIPFGRGEGGARGTVFIIQTLFADDFDQDALVPFAVKFIVEDLFPRTEVQLTIRDGAHGFAPHDAAFQMGIGIVLETVVMITVIRFFGSELFQPCFVVTVQTRFVVVDEYTGGDVHGVDQYEPFPYAAFVDRLLYVSCDVGDAASRLAEKMQFFAVVFQSMLLFVFLMWLHDTWFYCLL